METYLQKCTATQQCLAVLLHVKLYIIKLILSIFVLDKILRSITATDDVYFKVPPYSTHLQTI